MIREMKKTELKIVSDLLCESTTYLAEKEGFSPCQLDAMIRNRCSVESLESQSKLYQIYVYPDLSDVIGMVAVHENELAKLYVRPANHRQGVGQSLFAYAETHIMEKHDEMFLGAFPSAVPFYKAMGMQIKRWKTIDGGPLKGARQAIMVKDGLTVKT